MGEPEQTRSRKQEHVDIILKEDVRARANAWDDITLVHEALRRDGRSLYLAPDAIVYHDKRYRLGETLVRSFHLARSYAALRIEGGDLDRVVPPARIVTCCDWTPVRKSFTN